MIIQWEICFLNQKQKLSSFKNKDWFVGNRETFALNNYASPFGYYEGEDRWVSRD